MMRCGVMARGIYHKPVKTAPLAWRGPAIAVVSLGCGGRLPPSAVAAITAADLIIGSRRQLEMLATMAPGINGEQLPFPSPFSELATVLAHNQSQSIVILGSGDALFYGIGSWLVRVIGRQHLVFHPHISTVQACFHAIGQPWAGADIVSLHGRPLHALHRHLRANAVLAIFTDATNHPAAIAARFTALGLGDSTVWVCEAMGTDRQAVTPFPARQLARREQPFDPLNMCIAEVNGEPHELPSFPGIPEHWFSTGAEPGYGMLSKREVRLAILSLMQPQHGEIAWDLGAGCGSVSVEWARWNHQGHIYAIEMQPERVDHIRHNSAQFGTGLNLTVVAGQAPDCCADLPPPDCIFIGGSGNLAAMLAFGWEALRPGGKLVASAVTEASQTALCEFLHDRPGREWIEISVRKNLPHSTTIRALAPVQLGRCVKPVAP